MPTIDKSTGTEDNVREEYFENEATGVEVEPEVLPSPDEPSPGTRRRFGFTRSITRCANWST